MSDVTILYGTSTLHLTASARDPITNHVMWRNNDVEPGTRLSIFVYYMLYDRSDGYVTYTHRGYPWYFGTVTNTLGSNNYVEAPEPGETVTSHLPTYIPEEFELSPTQHAMLFNARVIILPYQNFHSGMGWWFENYGYGERSMGIVPDVTPNFFIMNAYDVKDFWKALRVS